MTGVYPPSSEAAPSSPTLISFPLASLDYNSTTYEADSGKLVRRLNTFTRSSIDGLGRPTGTENDLGITTTTVYAANGLKEYTDSSVGDKTAFDHHGRISSIHHKDNTSISYRYDKSNVTITDEAGHSSHKSYIAFGDPDEKYLTTVVDRVGTQANYSYNIDGKLTKIIFDGSQAGSYGYDGHFFLTSESHPETGTINYSRDSFGNITAITDSLGTRNLSYDKLNRLQKITSDAGTIEYGYDRDNNIVSVSSPDIQSSSSYDAVNRLTELGETIDSKTYQTGYTYDASGNIRQITYPSGRKVIYVYNGHKQVVAIPGYVDNIQYIPNQHANGFIASINFNNGISQSYDYTLRNRIASISAANRAANQDVVEKQYSYADERGNLTGVDDLLDSAENRSFSYDAQSRLTSFNGPWGQGSYSYSANGNRLTQAIGSEHSAYSYVNNRLTSVTGNAATGFDYNANGDVTRISRDGKTFALAYDPFHHLQSYSQGDSPLATFIYDASGRRIVKHDIKAGYTTVYHYDQAGHVLSEDNGDGTSIADYVYLHGNLLAKVANSAGQRSTDYDGDGLDDDIERNIGTDPYQTDTDADGISDGKEYTYWGDKWNTDTDGDGTINILDADSDNDGALDGAEIAAGTDPADSSSYPARTSIQAVLALLLCRSGRVDDIQTSAAIPDAFDSNADGDGFADGIEISQGTDPADASSMPKEIVYEDGEDQITDGWQVYDNDPAGATISNVYDEEHGSRVIEFAGGGTANGYRLQKNDGSDWNDPNFSNIEWSMKYSEGFIVYVAVQTAKGFRYLEYTPVDYNNLGDGTYIHHGLGSATMDGNWHTFSRNLRHDLKEAQPDNELQAVLGLLIRGSGRIDNIKTN